MVDLSRSVLRKSLRGGTGTAATACTTSGEFNSLLRKYASFRVDIGVKQSGPGVAYIQISTVAGSSRERMSMGIPMFSHVIIYEKVAVCQRVGLISVVLRLRPNRLATRN